MQSHPLPNSKVKVSLKDSSARPCKVGTQSMEIEETSNNRENFAKDQKTRFRVKKQNKANFSLNFNQNSNSQGKFVNIEKADAEEYNKITNDIKVSIKQKITKLNPQTTKTTFFCAKEDSFVGADPNRISRYRRPMGQTQRSREKWDKTLERYMQARTKMSIFFNETKKNSGEFDQIELDRNNIILRNRKILQLKSLSPKNTKTKNESQFVSYLIPKENKEGKFIKNEMIKSVSNNGNVKRCDALLEILQEKSEIRLVKENETDDPQLMEMVALQGNPIDDEIINTSMLQNSDRKQSQRVKTLKDQKEQYF